MSIGPGGYLGPTNNLTPIPHARGSEPSVSPKIVAMPSGWSFVQNQVSIDLSRQLDKGGGLESIQMVHFYNGTDPTNGAVDFDITALDTNHTIRIPAGSFGALPILTMSGRFVISQPGTTFNGKNAYPQIWISNIFDYPIVYTG